MTTNQQHQADFPVSTCAWYPTLLLPHGSYASMEDPKARAVEWTCLNYMSLRARMGKAICFVVLGITSGYSFVCAVQQSGSSILEDTLAMTVNQLMKGNIRGSAYRSSIRGERMSRGDVPVGQRQFSHQVLKRESLHPHTRIQ